MAHISIREFIRWLPDEASEPTSTVVVTSPQRRFVDIRVNRPANAAKDWPSNEEFVSLDQLDWVIAGTSTSWPLGHGPETHGQWRHWIDSRTEDAEDIVDEGDNYPQEDGTTLEKGQMVNPATGVNTEYEELWRDLEPISTDGSDTAKCIVLRLDKDGAKGSIVLLGQYCQGFFRKGSEIAGARWFWTQGKGWNRTILFGADILPCSEILENEALQLGGHVKGPDGNPWEIIEYA